MFTSLLNVSHKNNNSLAKGCILSEARSAPPFKSKSGLHQLTQNCYTIQENHYLTKHNFRARIRSCDYEDQHSFVVLTHKMLIDNFVALKCTYDHFEENDDARCYKQLLFFFSSSLTCDCLMLFILLILTQVYLQEYMSYQTHV
jgi:hypothetical protein